MTLIDFQASWSPRHDEPSRAHLVGPREPAGRFDTQQPPYIAVHIGGHGGVRVSLENPDDADALARLLTEATTRFRAALETGEWNETSFTAADLDTRAADDDTGGDPETEPVRAPVIAC